MVIFSARGIVPGGGGALRHWSGGGSSVASWRTAFGRPNAKVRGTSVAVLEAMDGRVLVPSNDVVRDLSRATSMLAWATRCVWRKKVHTEERRPSRIEVTQEPCQRPHSLTTLAIVRPHTDRTQSRTAQLFLQTRGKPWGNPSIRAGFMLEPPSSPPAPALLPAAPGPAAGTDLSDLLCALTTQGGVTFLGYLAGATGIIGEGRSISLFVSRVALPCLLMQSLANASFESLNVCFLLIMLLSKGLTLVVGGLLGSRLLSGSRLKSAAVGGLLTSCSNDLAFGLPIVNALYPELSIYVVLLAMMQNAFLNQFCFVMMEAGLAVDKGRPDGDRRACSGAC